MCCLVEAQGVRNRDDIHLGNANQFAIAAIHTVTQYREFAAEVLLTRGAHGAVIAEHHRRQQDPLSCFRPRYKFTDFLHYAGNIAPVDVRKIYSRQALSHPQIEVIEGACLDPHQNLVLPQFGIGNIGIL